MNINENISQNIFLKNPEFSSNNSLALITLESLVSVCLKHQKLGDNGKNKDVINQFGEQALIADLTAEKTVIEKLSEYSKINGINFEINGEETGISVFKNGEKKYFGVLDGLDGSANYINPNEWSYGTMLTIAKGDNPKYQDFEVAAIGLPEENWILMAIKNNGVFIYDIDKKEYFKLKPFNTDDYNENKILSDNYFPEAKLMLGKMQEIWPRTGSTAASIVAMSISNEIIDNKYPKMNENWQGLVDVTRKGNLEQPAIYLIISELGGVMIDKNGQDIGHNYFKDWGQKEKIPVISAKSQKIAEKILSKLNL